MTLPFAIENEQEAAISIMLSCMIGQPNQQVIDAQFRQLSRMVLFSAKFQGHPLEPLVEKAMPLLAAYGTKNVLEYSAPFITDSFRETLFAMICELLTMDGELTAAESEIVAMAALHLGISMELMRVMITTFLLRNRWNLLT